MKETEIWELLVSLSSNEISLAEAHDKILRLFNVVNRRELLLAFHKAIIPEDVVRKSGYTREEIVGAFLKSQ